MEDNTDLVSNITDDHLLHEEDNENQQNVKEEIQEEEEEEKQTDDNDNVNTNLDKSNPNSNITVAVTGASGFIAAHCIKQLLEKGYNVRGTVRGDPSSEKYKWLYDISTKLNLSNKVELYQANLLKDGSFTECFKNCDYIFHVASPFAMNVTDAMKDLVEPAKNGTLNVLKCALNVCNDNKLKRIVVTSSVAAVNGLSDPKRLYDETDWNNESDLSHGPYSFSKTEAERAAWDWMENNKSKVSFDLIAINPALVLGKHLNDGLQTLNESNDLFGRIINGAFPVRINVSFTIVDVRDVAAAHIFMIENEKGKTSSGRHICCNDYLVLSTMMDYAEEYCKNNKISAKIPCCRCDCSCCWCFIMCIACCQTPGEADYLRGAVNRGTHYNNNKLKQLGFEYRDRNSTLIYTLDYLRDAGFIRKQ